MPTFGTPVETVRYLRLLGGELATNRVGFVLVGYYNPGDIFNGRSEGNVYL